VTKKEISAGRFAQTGADFLFQRVLTSYQDENYI